MLILLSRFSILENAATTVPAAIPVTVCDKISIRFQNGKENKKERGRLFALK